MSTSIQDHFSSNLSLDPLYGIIGALTVPLLRHNHDIPNTSTSIETKRNFSHLEPTINLKN